jgi:hypothetical protein
MAAIAHVWNAVLIWLSAVSAPTDRLKCLSRQRSRERDRRRSHAWISRWAIMSSATCIGETAGRDGTHQGRRHDDTRVDLDQCNRNVRPCVRHSRGSPRHDAACRPDVARDDISGDDARRRRVPHRLRNILPAGRSLRQEAVGPRPLRPRSFRCYFAWRKA